MQRINIETFEEVLGAENIKSFISLGIIWKTINSKINKQVYINTQDNIILFKKSLCQFGPNTRNCKLATINDLIYTHIHPFPVEGIFVLTQINFIEIPDFIMDIMIGIKMNELLASNSIIGVPKMISYSIDNKNITDAAMYQSIDLLDPLPALVFGFGSGKIGLANIAFRMWQVMVCISFLQYHMRFVHYDLHWENIMSQKLDSICLHYEKIISIAVPEMTWPIISDFGSSIFSKMNGTTREQFLNTTNNLNKPKEWTEFNRYFDGLTLLKSLALYGANQIPKVNFSIFDTNMASLVECFIKPGIDGRQYFNNPDDPTLYRPDINKILANEEGLFTVNEVIYNLYKNFHPTSTGGFEKLLLDKEMKGCNNESIFRKVGEIGIDIPIYPILPPDSIPDIPFFKNKCYFLNFLNEPKPIKPENNSCISRIPNGIDNLNIIPIFEVSTPNVFVFSLFAAPRYFNQIYMWFFDKNYNHEADGGMLGKNSPDAFFTWYLENQINESIKLINDLLSDGSRPIFQNQWEDFGCLMMVDHHTMNLPMMMESGGQLWPWSKETYKPIVINDIAEREKISQIVRVVGGISKLLKTNNWGTVGDYIKWKVLKNIRSHKRYRYGLYEYSLPKRMDDKVKIPIIQPDQSKLDEDISIYGIMMSPGMLGSIVRFSALQDPQFDCILFRDAHSTMPNRNYIYDRKWYETWRQNTDKRLWVYNGAFYNPAHGDGQKISFAAAWGACKRISSQYTIFTELEYEKAFNFSKPGNKYYNRTDYGVDERIMFRLTNMTLWKENSYFVGIVHMSYLISGQDNPREYRIFQDAQEGQKFTPDDFIDYEDQSAMLRNTNNKPEICRELTFGLPSKSFYTDIRCVFLNSIHQAAWDLNKNIDTMTFLEYYEWLDRYLMRTVSGPMMLQNLIEMIPPRWNIWSFLFGEINMDNLSIVDNIMEQSFGINLTTICRINKLMWTGNVFNLDSYFFGEEKQLPSINQLPVLYPHVPKI